MKKMMMLILAALILPAPALRASVFDEAAKLYIDGKMNQARQLIELGLKQNPDDEKLKALLEKIKKQQEQNQKNSDNQDKSGKKDDKKEQDKQPQDQKEKKKQQDDPQKKQGEQQPQKGDEQKQPPPPAQKQKISKDEAQRILNALRESEKEAQKKKPPVKVPARRKTDKDW